MDKKCEELKQPNVINDSFSNNTTTENQAIKIVFHSYQQYLDNFIKHELWKSVEKFGAQKRH